MLSAARWLTVAHRVSLDFRRSPIPASAPPHPVATRRGVGTPNLSRGLGTAAGMADPDGVADARFDASGVEIEIPLLVGWEKTYKIEVRVEADLQGSGVRFVISPKNLTEVLHQLLNDQVPHLRETLGEGWLVVRGTPKLDRSSDANARPSERGNY